MSPLSSRFKKAAIRHILIGSWRYADEPQCQCLNGLKNKVVATKANILSTFLSQQNLELTLNLLFTFTFWVDQKDKKWSTPIRISIFSYSSLRVSTQTVSQLGANSPAMRKWYLKDNTWNLLHKRKVNVFKFQQILESTYTTCWDANFLQPD